MSKGSALSAEATTERNDTEISLREAVNIGREFMRVAYPDGLEDLQLEEIDRSDDDRYWLLTFGFIRYEPPSTRGTFTILPALADQEKTRVYKVVAVDASSGDVRSMKIRTP